MEPRSRIRWDPTVTAGNVLTAAAMLVALLSWGLRLENQVAEHDRRIDQLEVQRRRDDAETMVLREGLAGMKADLNTLTQSTARIEQRLYTIQERRP